MKKVLIGMCALVACAGMAMAEETGTQQTPATQSPSNAYMWGYNESYAGRKNTCEQKYDDKKTTGFANSNEIKNIYDCNQGYSQREDEKLKNTQPSN